MKKNIILLGIELSPVDMDQALQIVVENISAKSAGYFCFANIHVVMEGNRRPEIRNILSDSTANFPDGMGVAWALKLLGHKFHDRVRGADFMLKLCEHAALHNLKVFFYGNTEETLEKLKNRLKALFPGLEIAGSASPPFRPLTRQEDDAYIKQINDSGADILFVSLGAPTERRRRVEAQLLGGCLAVA